MYLCDMGQRISKKFHPLQRNSNKISADGIVIIDDVNDLPDISTPFISPDYVICIVHSGNMNLVYDDNYDVIQSRSIAVIFPNHRLTMVNKSDDYKATLVVVSASAMNEPMLQIIDYYRFYYEQQPMVTLNEHDYNVIMSLIEVIREISIIDIHYRSTIIIRQMELLSRLLNYYRRNMFDNKFDARRISLKFMEAIEEHFHEHRDVAFYANLACYTPKYFSTVVRRQTGHSALFWINARIIAEAKILLHSHNNFSIKEVADILGFTDQNAFSRFFKHETGISPTKFINNRQ